LDSSLIHFVDALRRQTTLEGAATLGLERALEQAALTVGEAGVLGAWLQVSAGNPWISAHPPAAERVTGLDELAPSLWALMQQRRACVALDLRRQRLWSEPGEPGVPWRLEQGSAPEASHFLLAPLWTPGQRLDGIVGLALHVPERGQLERAYSDLSAPVQAIADLLGPSLALLPRRGRVSVAEHGPWLPVVGRAMAPIIETLDAYARTDEILLLRGPTGTGKSRLAFWCWLHSPRASGRFVVANLLGVPESGQDSELFGVRKGTFTGVGERPGQVQAAQGGTLFLDEIDKLSVAAQVKLLRLLDERRFRVLGEGTDREADVRFIVASNADLEALVAQGRLLEDLYYRINVLPVRIPGLSARQDEIGPWAVHMARELHQARAGNDAVELSPLAVDFLLHQPWPGNLRQLHNVIRRAYALAAVGAARATDATSPAGEVLIQRTHIERALSDEPPPSGLPELGSLELLRRGARGVVQLAQRRRAEGIPALGGRDGDLELADAFRGLVLECALERAGDLRSAFELFGLEGRLRGGNHLRTWRQARAMVGHLERAFAEEPAPGGTTPAGAARRSTP